ncbi:autism susceptibility gene 2 protein isoform X2 [Neoarius graeffei]|uniref:autism susceptibility gene 2 protein isoform X2 n=1 Tax=Neoarius graeffei TaxID=443677 RepID=UPI00298CF5AD|nr:autism susceptibility gene 2 protein isoform X2 [Neoarius graeffei]
MEGKKVKQTRRSRMHRERVQQRRRETRTEPSPASSGSERERRAAAAAAAVSAAAHVNQNGRKSAHSASSSSTTSSSSSSSSSSSCTSSSPIISSSVFSSRGSRGAPRRKRRVSSSQDEEEEEEDIIDGFAITSFSSLECLQRNGSVKLNGSRKERRWETAAAVKRQKPAEEEKEEEVKDEMEENGFDLPNNTEHTQERLLQRTYSNKSKRFKSVLSQTVRSVTESKVPDVTSTANRSSSKDRLSESSTHSLSGRGYSCDSESDIDDKASDVGSEKLFSPTAPKAVTSNESFESKICGSPKISGLQRSQEQSTIVSFAPPTSSPAPTGSPIPAATATPKSPPPVTIKKELTPSSNPDPTPHFIRNQSDLQDHKVTPPSHHSQPIISHHHPPATNHLTYGLHDISNSPSSLPPKHPLPPSPAPPLPLSIAALSSPHYPLRSSSHLSPLSRHPAMFAPPAALPPPPALPTNSLVVPGHPAATPYPEHHDLLRQELNNRFLVQSSERGRGSAPGATGSPLSQMSLLRAEFHQHQHMHQHQHTHQHTFTPFPAIIGPPTAPPMVRTAARNFDKYAPKLDNPFLRQSSFFSSYPPAMPGMPPLLPHPGPFSSLQGAFQPKASNPIDVATRPGAVPHTLLQKDPRLTDPFRTSVRKPGKWCAVHVQIAWQIYHHQQKMKQMQLDPHKLDITGKLDLFSRPPAPGVFPGFPYPHDLARPLFPSTGSGHPVTSPYGPAPHHSSFLPPTHLAGKYAFSRSSSFGNLGNLSANAFGGLGNPALGSNSVFGPKDGPPLPGFSSPSQDSWNRLHRTPPSFPQWPKVSDGERSSSANSHEREKEREKEREREKRDSSIGKDEKDKDRDNRHSNRSSPASAPVSYQISNLIRCNSGGGSDVGRNHGDRPRGDPEREALVLSEVRAKDRSRSPMKECSERSASSSSVDSCKPILRSPSPFSKNKSEPVGIPLSDRKLSSPGAPVHKLKNDTTKIKEERKEQEQEVLVLGSEPPPPQNPSQNQPPPLPPHHQAPPPTIPHSLPFVHQMGGLNVLDRARLAPFVGVGHFAATANRDRFPHPAFSWDPLREAYRNLDLQRRMDFQIRSETGNRFPGIYEADRNYRDREPHEYSHQDHLIEVRREQERIRQQAEERERLHLRDELERARLHQLHQSPMEGHLPHMPPFLPHLGAMPYRPPPTAALSAPPPLVPSVRPNSPRRTTQDTREFSPSRNPKEVEAR